MVELRIGLIGLLLLGFWIGAALAQQDGRGRRYPNGLYALTPGGSGPPPMTCTNKLDFQVACNSQYLGKGIVQ